MGFSISKFAHESSKLQVKRVVVFNVGVLVVGDLVGSSVVLEDGLKLVDFTVEKVEVESSLVEVESSLVEVESSLVEVISSLVEVESSKVEVKSRTVEKVPVIANEVSIS